MNKEVLTHALSEPLHGAKAARVDIHAGDGNLTIDRLAGGEQLLASGTLQYFEVQGQPTRSLIVSNGQAALTLRGGAAGKPWFRFPWSACNGATEWQIRLNPTVSYDIAAHSDGGNLRLALAGMAVTRVSAATGGGNMDVLLPGKANDLSVSAKTGAGNVTLELGSAIVGRNTVNASSGAGNVEVRIPGGVAARIHVTTGLGKAIVDPRFNKSGEDTYQSSDFDQAVNKVEITVHSGAGNVIINSR